MSKVKHWPTRKIQEVLEENYTRGINGRDFEELKPELEAELWKRQEKQDLEKFERDLIRYEAM